MKMTKKLIGLLFLLGLGIGAATAQNSAIQGFCTVGGQKVLTSGSSSSTFVQASYPKCLVSVYLSGTTTLAPLFGSPDGSGTPPGNPFTANTNGSWLAYSATGVAVDVVMSGGSPNPFPVPFTLVGLNSASGGGGGGVIQITPGANVTCTPNSGGSCTGNVTINATGGGGSSILDQYVVPLTSTGISSYFVTPNLLGIVTNPTTDNTFMPTQDGSLLFDWRSTHGTPGFRTLNPFLLSGDDPNGLRGVIRFTDQLSAWPFVVSQTKSYGLVSNTPDAATFNNYCEGYSSWSVGQPACGGVQILQESYIGGQKQGLHIQQYAHGAQDLNSFQQFVHFFGGAYTASDQGNTIRGTNVIQFGDFPRGTITGGGSGSRTPTFSNQGDPAFSAQGLVMDTTTPVYTGTMQAGGTAVTYGAVGFMEIASANRGVGNTPGPNQPVICSGGGGAGASAQVFVASDGGTGGEPFNIIGGTGYTSIPTCILDPSLSPPGSTPPVITVDLFTTQFSSMKTLQTSGGLVVSPHQALLNTGITAGPDHVTGVYTTSTVTVSNQVGGGPGSTGGLQVGPVWIADGFLAELCNITTRNTDVGVGGIQTVTLSCLQSHFTNVGMFQGGTNGYVCLDGDNVNDGAWHAWPFCIYAFGSTATNQLVYGWKSHGGIGNVIPITGAQRASFDAGRNGISVYNGAEVILTAPQSYGTAPLLTFNTNNWANGHTFFQGPATTVTTFMQLDQYGANTIGNPQNSGMLSEQYLGQTINNNFSPLQLDNANNQGLYNGCSRTTSDIDTCRTPINPADNGYLFAPTAISIIRQHGTGLSMAIPKNGATVIFAGDSGVGVRYPIIQTQTVGALLADIPNGRMAFDGNLGVGDLQVRGNQTNEGAIDTGHNPLTTGSLSVTGTGFPTTGLKLWLGVNSQAILSAGTTPTTVAQYSSNAILSLGQVISGIGYFGSQPASNKNVFITGTPGTTTVQYCFVYHTTAGDSDGSDCVQVTNSNASLALSLNFPTAVAELGVVNFDIYRSTNTGGFATGKICTNVPVITQQCLDNGQAPSGSLPTVDKSGMLTVRGPAVASTVGSGVATNTDLVGELAFAGVTTASYTFIQTYTSHPECFAQAQATTASSGTPWITYTSTTSFTINTTSAFTGNISYSCLARN